MKPIEKLVMIAEAHRVPIKDIARLANIPPTTMYGWIKHGRDIPTQHLLPICSALNIFPEDLISDDDSVMFRRLTDDEEQMLKLYRELDEDGRIIIKAKLLEEVRGQRAAKGA